MSLNNLIRQLYVVFGGSQTSRLLWQPDKSSSVVERAFLSRSPFSWWSCRLLVKLGELQTYCRVWYSRCWYSSCCQQYQQLQYQQQLCWYSCCWNWLEQQCWNWLGVGVGRWGGGRQVVRVLVGSGLDCVESIS